MSNDINITFAADSKAAQQALDQLQVKLDRTEKKLDQLRMRSNKSTHESRRGFEGVKSSIGGVLNSLGAAAASYLTLGKAIQLVGQEFEETRRKQKAFLDASLEPAEALAQVKLNFVPDKTLSRKDFEKEIFKLAKEINQPVAQTSNTLGGVLSAKGDLTAQQGFELVRQAGRLRILDPEFNKQIAEAAGDIAKKERIDDPRVLIGSLINMQAAARTTKLDKLGKNLLPGIIAMRNFGFTFEQSAELGSTITQLSGDAEGEQTGTALPGFGQKLKDFVPKRATKGKFRGQYVASDARGEFAIPDKQVAEFEKAMRESPNDVFEIFQRSPELRRAFEQELSGSLRAKVRQPFISLLRGDKEAMGVFRNVQNIIQPLDENQAQRFEEQVKFQASGALEPTAEAKRKADVEHEQALLENTVNQRIALARKKFEDTLELVDLPGVDTLMTTPVKAGLEKQFKRIKLEGGSPEQEVVKALELFPTKGKKYNPFVEDMSPDDIKILREAIQSLKSTSEEMGPVPPNPQAQLPQDSSGTGIKAFPQRAPRQFGGETLSGDRETLSVLQQIAENTKELKDEWNTRPRQTTRKSSGLSRTDGSGGTW